MYTVKQLSDLAGVTVRTLHYYDEIGLLKPSSTGQNGYRYYSDEALFRLQQILFFRELDLDLELIKKILDEPGFDQVTALQTHRQAIEKKIERMKELIKTIDTTVLHFVGEVNMTKKQIFKGFDPETEKRYEEEAINNWGESAAESIKLWKSYSEEKKEQIKQEGGKIYLDIIANMQLGPKSPEIQAILVHWHQHMRYFYEPSLEVLKGLGDMYHDHPDFNATFTAMHPDLPAFLKEAIACYVDELETQWLEKELGILRDQYE